MATNLPVFACSLTASGQRERLSEWKSLLAGAESREELPTGIRFRFRPELAERVRSLAAAEQECCSFLRFEVVEGGDDVVMTVETEEAGQEALRFIFGPA
jgi:MerR family copper efflux transcriptional regulator